MEYIIPILNSPLDLRARVEDDHLDGNTALMWAIANAHSNVSMGILISGNITLKESLAIQCFQMKNTALHLAVGKGYRDKSADGQSLTFSNVALVEKMLVLGANPNLKNEAGNTPLHLAFARRDRELMDLLGRYGADLYAVNKKGQTPFDLLKTTYQDLQGLLKQTVFIYLLDEKEFYDNHTFILQLLYTEPDSKVIF